MPFEPRLVESEEAPLDEQGEIILPVELTELAERLTSESECLSREFIDRPPTSSLPAARSARRVCGGLLAISALLLLAPWMTYLLWRNPPLGPTVETPGTAENRALAGGEGDAAEDVVGTDRIVGLKESTSQEPPLLPSPVSRDPDRFLRDLTGPELEGVLDLLETETSPASRLSI